jgi:uncharacterized membrane protein
MYKLIGGDQKESGPVTADQLRQWILVGRANSQSLVQAEGADEWKPLGALPEFADLLGAASAIPAGASADSWGKASGAQATMLAADLASRPSHLEVGNCLAAGWRLLRGSPGLLAGAAAIVWAIHVALSFVPLIGGIAAFLIGPVLQGGLCLVFLRRGRGEPTSINDVFAGFSFRFAPLMLTGVVSGLLAVIGYFCCVLPGLYLQIAWLFAVPLVADKGMDFWAAMELSRKLVTRHWFKVFGLILLLCLPLLIFSVFVFFRVMQLALAQASSGPPTLQEMMALMVRLTPLTFCAQVVSLLILPFMTAALMSAYESLFGTRRTPPA